MSTRELRFRLVIENTQFLTAAAQAGTGITGMGRAIVDSATRSSGALDGITDSARGIGAGAQQGAQGAAQALNQTAAAAAATGRAATDAAGRMGTVGGEATHAGATAQQAFSQAAQGATAAAQAINTTDQAAQRVKASFGEVAKGAVVFGAITSAAQAASNAIASIPSKGINFIADTEVTQLGMSGILQSMTEINGKATTFAQAQDMAAGAVERLQIAAAQTSASTGELVETYRSLLGPALAAGMSMQQLERFTVVGTNAVKSMGLPLNQVVQELRSIVSGQINADSSVAKALGIDNSDVEKAKASAEGLFGFLSGKLSGFASASDAYGKTLRGTMESLEEQITQSAAKSMTPVAAAAKEAMDQIGESLKGGGAQAAMDSLGEGMATTIRTISSGVSIAREYSGAVMAIAEAYAAIKVGTIAAQFVGVANAKLQAGTASRLAATQAVLSAEAGAAEAQSSRAVLAALIAEERQKVQALATEAAVTAAKLRSAEATAAQLVGMQRLAAVEAEVMPLRQAHAAQTAALEQAQQRLATATTAASGASQAMGAVVGALGGPIGIAITAATLLAGAFMSARSEAEKLGKVKVSTDRIEDTINKGGKADSGDTSRIQAALSEAKEERDALLAKSKQGFSMYDRSPGPLGGKSAAQKLMDELAEAEERVKKFEDLVNRANASQVKPSVARQQFAAAAAEQLGVPMEAILAHTQMETGKDGTKTVGAYNYGNIKAGKSWDGATAAVKAKEYTGDGNAYTEDAKFRSYASPEDAAADYVKLIKSRYPAAAGARSTEDFAKGLKSGGYATDPDYVKKLTGVAASLPASSIKGAGAGEDIVGLNAGASRKQLDEILKKAGGEEQIKKQASEELAALDSAAKAERTAMERRSADAAALQQLDAQVAAARITIEKDLHDKLKAAREKGLAEVSQLSKAQSEQIIAEAKASSDARVRSLDEEQAQIENRYRMGLVGVEQYEAERVRIQRAKLGEKMGLIDLELKAQEKRKPKDQIEKLEIKTKATTLNAQKDAVGGEIKATGAAAASGIKERTTADERQSVADTLQVWQQANTQIEQMRKQNSAAKIGLITDPISKLQAETAAQVGALNASADELTGRLRLQLNIAVDPVQREQLKAQIADVTEQTGRAIELANDGLAERMKPGWQTMLDGWRDTNRLMRESSDQTMHGLITKGEEAFVGFVKTGKLSIKGLADDWIANVARTEFRKFTAGETGSKITGGLASLVGVKPVAKVDAGLTGPTLPYGNAGAGDYSSAGMKKVFGDSTDRAVDGLTVGAKDAASGLRDAATEGTALTGALSAVGRSLGGFGGDVMRAGSALLSMLQTAGSGTAGGGSSGIAGLLVAGVKAWAGGVGSAGNAGMGDYSAAGMKAAYGYAKGGAFDRDEIKFAGGGAFTNQVVDRDTSFRFRDGGREKLGLMGEAGPEAIMPLSGGGAQAISADGRKLGHVPVQRGPSGRLSVVLDGILAAAAPRPALAMVGAAPAGPGRLSAFAVGAVFGGSSPTTSQLAIGASSQLKASTAASAAVKAGNVAIDASTTLNVMDMGKVQALVSQACMGVERRIYEHLRATGAMR